jgi:hypothetical protein
MTTFIQKCFEYKQTIFSLTKVLVLSVFAFLIYQKIYLEAGWILFTESFFRLDTIENYIFIALAMALIPVNMMAEAKKWMTVTEPIAKLSFAESFKAITLGSSMGIITPSRLGEYAGRLYGIDRKYTVQALASNVYCSVSQNIVNLFMGFIALAFDATLTQGLSTYLTTPILSLGLLFTLILVVVYYFFDLVVEYLMKVGYISQWLKNRGLKDTPVKLSMKVLNQNMMWSLLRYLIYFSQYILIAKAFEFNISIGAMAGGASILFLIQTGLVLPPILGLIARGEAALLVWSAYGVQAGDILSGALTIWVFNLLIPATIGFYWFLKLKLDR